MGNLSREEISHYARQIVLPEIGLEGQQQLKTSSVLIVGAGGLGSPAALYLAAAGIGHIGIVDFDAVDRSNLQRQVIHADQSIGMPKVLSAARRLAELNTDIQVEAYNEVFDASSAMRISAGYDLIMDASDNFPTRYLINDLCVLTQRPFVYGAVSRFEGQIGTYMPGNGPCYRCIFPVPPPAESVSGCAVAGVLGAIPGIVGTLQAAEGIKILLGLGTPLTERLLLIDALDMGFQTVQFSRNTQCAVCGDHPTIMQLMDTQEFCGSSILPAKPTAAADITVYELKTSLSSGIPMQILDVREPGERQISDFPGALHIRLAELKDRLSELDPSMETVVYCRSGIRSMKAVEVLKQSGFAKVYNLRGGINAWAQEIDPEQIVY